MGNERGRPRAFDADRALDRALEVFWRHGFQSASLSELTEAMDLSKPSLYAAFGDKEALYLKALERYKQKWIEKLVAALDTEPDARHAVRGFMRAVAGMQADPALPGGCFIVTGSADCGAAGMPAAVDAALREAVQGTEMTLRARLRRAQREGQLPEHLRVNDFAAFLGTVLAGLAVQAKAGASRARIDAIIDAALAAWPAD
jgi:TetR/AcrR family transcriptional regulator, copper-responsive repressor